MLKEYDLKKFLLSDIRISSKFKRLKLGIAIISERSLSFRQISLFFVSKLSSLFIFRSFMIVT